MTNTSTAPAHRDPAADASEAAHRALTGTPPVGKAATQEAPPKGAAGDPADNGRLTDAERRAFVKRHAALHPDDRDAVERMVKLTARNARAEAEGGEPDDDGRPLRLHVVTLQDFAAVDEPGGEPIIGEHGDAVMVEGADSLTYGNGGAGKTTLEIDRAFHLAAGLGWLGFPIPKKRRVLLVENEGPRPLFRQKLRAKLNAWGDLHPDDPVDDRLHVFVGEPSEDGEAVADRRDWGDFTIRDPRWRAALAAYIAKQEIDVVVIGPITTVGMNDAGTIQQCREFAGLVRDVRRLSERPAVSFVLVHHENKDGTPSGAWEGVGDSLLHVKGAGNGHTHLHVDKARWGGRTYHGETFKLAWAAEGEGFTVEEAVDYPASIRAYLDGREAGPATSAEGIAKGLAVKCSATTVRAHLDEVEGLRFYTGPEAKARGAEAANAKLYYVS